MLVSLPPSLPVVPPSREGGVAASSSEVIPLVESTSPPSREGGTTGREGGRGGRETKRGEPSRRDADPTAFALRWNFAPDSPLLRQALTHRSAVGGVSARSNERLEFLGDALLSAWVARILFDTLPEGTEEGALSRARVQVIRQETLAAAARELGLADLLVIGHGERKERRQNHDSLLSDAFEALIAATFREQGEAAMEAFLQTTLGAPLAAVIAAPPAPDPKTLLQMRLQALGRGLPTYRTIEATGIGHDHHFVIEALAENGDVLSRGEGPNKRIAQAEAARVALAALPA